MQTFRAQGALVRRLRRCRGDLPYGLDEMGLRGVFPAGGARRIVPGRVARARQAGGTGEDQRTKGHDRGVAFGAFRCSGSGPLARVTPPIYLFAFLSLR